MRWGKTPEQPTNVVVRFQLCTISHPLSAHFYFASIHIFTEIQISHSVDISNQERDDDDDDLPVDAQTVHSVKILQHLLSLPLQLGCVAIQYYAADYDKLNVYWNSTFIVAEWKKNFQLFLCALDNSVMAKQLIA